MKQTAILEKILCTQDQFTESEQILSKYVTAHIGSIEGLSISEFQQNSGVSAPTISRFCRKLGFESYRQFSLALSKESAEAYAQIHITADIKDDTACTAKKLCDIEINTLQSTYNMLDIQNVEQVVEKLLGAGRIFIFATGGSVAIGYDLYHKLIRLSLPCDFQQESIYQKMLIQSAREGDCIFTIALSGYDKDMVWITEEAKKRKVFCVVMTNGLHSPVTQYADVCLYGTYRDDFTYTGTIESRLSQLFIIDLLFILLSMKGAPGTLDALQQTKQVLESHKVPRK